MASFIIFLFRCWDYPVARGTDERARLRDAIRTAIHITLAPGGPNVRLSHWPLYKKTQQTMTKNTVQN